MNLRQIRPVQLSSEEHKETNVGGLEIWRGYSIQAGREKVLVLLFMREAAGAALYWEW